MSGHISTDNNAVVETHRRWSHDEWRRALEETQHLPVSAVARKHGIAKSLLFRWRKEAGLTGKRRHVEGSVPVRIAATPVISLPRPSTPAPVTHEGGSIEIELVGGIKLAANNVDRMEIDATL